jgi:TonB-dependent Receptor Plug Domain
VPLELGMISEQLVVLAKALQVDTRSSAVGVVVDSKRMEELPLINRSALSLVQLVPGVATATLPPVVVNQRGGPNMSIGGTRYGQSVVMLDGAELTASLGNTAQNLPSPDSLQEFQVLTSTYNAEYGRAAGATLMAITKSGTNAVHGGLWEYFRDDSLNTKNFFAPSKPYLRQNQFGANAGGPVIRNRTFVFGNYEGIRLGQQAILRFFPSTAAERTGDFSATARPIIDPATGLPFPGNRIPADRIDPLARNYLSAYLPLPNQGSEYVALAQRPVDGNQFTFRADHEIVDSNTLSVRWYRTKTVGQVGAVPALETEQGNVLQSTTVSNTHVFRSNLLSEGRVSYTTIRTTSPSPSANKTPRELGALYDQDGATPKAPNVNVSGAFNISQIVPWDEQSKLVDFDYKMSWFRGGHDVKFGASFLRTTQFIQTQFQTSGTFTFTGVFTGTALADLMIGRPASFAQMSVLNNLEYGKTWGGFVQDNVKLGRVTMNLGLRYQLFVPWVEKGGRSATFRPEQQSTRYPNAPLGMVFPGDTGVPETLSDLDKNNLAPRVGFAWDVRGDGRTAVRGGYGIFYSPEAAVVSARANEAAPFTQNITFVPASFTNPYAGRTSPFPYIASTSGEAFFALPAAVASVDPAFRTGYLHQYNVNVQQQFASDIVFQIGYFGSLGRNLVSAREINPAVFGPGATAANAQQRRSYFPQFFAGIDQTFSDGSSRYDSLQVIGTKRYARAYTMQIAYTLSKSMDDCAQYPPSAQAGRTCVQNPFRPISDEWARASFDRRHVLRINGIWDLPQLEDRRALRHVFGGWRLAGIVSKTSGLPITVTSGADIAALGPSRGLAQQRPNLVGNPELPGDRSRDEKILAYFNTAAFERPALGQFGDAPRNLLTGPGLFTTDASITKRFQPLAGAAGRGVEFRLEVFNLFNTVNLGQPTDVLASPAFGRILTAGDGRIVQLGLRFEF